MAILKALISALTLASLGSAIPLLERKATYTTTVYKVAAAPTATAASSASTDVTLPGIAYAPYRADHKCKTENQIQDDFSHMKGQYSLVRIYGTDCNQVGLVYAAAKKINMKVFLGIWNINDVSNEANLIISGVNGDWSSVDTISVGNELVNGGQATPDQVIAAIKQARTILRKAGYNGPVVTVDTFVAAGAHPEICKESDYCAINAHAFFDSTVTAAQAGAWLQKTVASVKAATGKKVVVTESGWPTKGSNNGLAIPGTQQQLEAITSIKKAFSSNPGDLILFTAFNTPWKTEDPRTFNAEPYWGIGGAISSSDS